ncbi:7347_t:CDS:2 [Diversispora eburnea]|uniref:Eukaryotic translation initiation factor 3 30 kDa subunit n=1 Tax=Diversispora eburnea TaxID=1213867 RepID=A0A9N8UZ74_9GLOM|nr:7347_t:CDS:2 [Diversispora eburnea]
MNWGNDSDGPAPNISVSVNKKWVDEDLELDQVKEAWDQESSDEEEGKVKTEDISKKKKVSIAKKIAEREQKKKTERLFDVEDDELDLEEKKRREAQAILDADLENAEGLFQGLTIKDTGRKSKELTTPSNKEGTIKVVEASPLDRINPQTSEEFDEFASLLSERIKKYEKNKFYPNFVSGLVRELCLNLRDVEIRKITGTLTNLANEKSKDTQKTKKKAM